MTDPLSETNHLLVTLSEECAEVAKEALELSIRVSKALRFGLDEVQPGQLLSNMERLAQELGELVAVGQRLIEAGVIAADVIPKKNLKVDTFLAYASQIGAVKMDFCYKIEVEITLNRGDLAMVNPKTGMLTPVYLPNRKSIVGAAATTIKAGSMALVVRTSVGTLIYPDGDVRSLGFPLVPILKEQKKS